MKAPSYRERLLLLEEVLAGGIVLFRRLHESEEQLREQLITGNHRALIEAEEKRASIREEITALEERRKILVPEGTGLQTYIKTKIGKSSQGRLLARLNLIIRELREIKVISAVNRNLLEERLRFSKELQEKLLDSRLTYNENGRLKKQETGPSQNLDHSC